MPRKTKIIGRTRALFQPCFALLLIKYILQWKSGDYEYQQRTGSKWKDEERSEQRGREISKASLSRERKRGKEKKCTEQRGQATQGKRRAGSKKREKEGERRPRAWKMREETARWMAMAWSVLEERTREKKEKTGGGGGEEEGKERRKRERKKESIGLCSRPSQCVLVASVCPFVPVHVRTSVRCLPWHSNRVYSRLAPVEGLWPIITWSLCSLRFF